MDDKPCVKASLKQAMVHFVQADEFNQQARDEIERARRCVVQAITEISNDNRKLLEKIGYFEYDHET